MKRKLLYVLLCAEAAICVLAALLIPSDAGGFVAVWQLPFGQAGALLRAMSLSGSMGNAIAFVLYVIICCVPAAFLLIKLVKKRAKAEDALLAAMSAYLFYLMYMMINPGNIGGSISMGSEDIGKSALASVFWSLLIGWFVLKLLRFARDRQTADILNMLSILFTLTTFVIVFASAYIGTSDLKTSIKALEASNTDTTSQAIVNMEMGNIGAYDALAPTKAFLIFRYIVGQIPAVMDVLIFISAKTLAKQLKVERYSIDVVNTSKRLASLCKFAVIIAVLSTLLINLTQLVFSGSLRSMNFNNTIPISSILIALVMLLLSRYFAESRKIKQENEMFV